MPNRYKYIFACLLTITLSLILLSYLLPPKAVAVSGDYIKWVDFNVTAEQLKCAVKCDLSTYEAAKSGNAAHAPMVTLLALAAAKHGGDMSRCKLSELESFASRIAGGEAPDKLTSNPKLFAYYQKAYGAVLGGFMGSYAVNTESGLEKRYGLKVFSPIAAGYHYSDYDDFGAARSYGYSRPHLGHDMMGSVGTPIVAIESGYVEVCGWNRYGGWRIGIRSYDGQRYYYYAHLRRGHPFADLYEGKQITAGEVIGYLGMTGYSAKEDTNGIDTPHLHLGLQLIFDKSQKDGSNQIWLDLYELSKFLSGQRSEVAYNSQTGELYAKSPILDLDIPD